MRTFALALTCCLISTTSIAANRYNFEPGDPVLTNCNQIYSKGVVKSKVVDGYVIHFDKHSRPIRCPPFRWAFEFVLPYGSVNEYSFTAKAEGFFGKSKEIVFKVGEPVTFMLKTDPRIEKLLKAVDVQAEITDISGIGAIAVKPLSTEPSAVAAFWQWIGTNYVDVNHDALAKERETRINKP